ncbi:MAG: hypothetical protein PHY05_02465 [Methanothrix sp.]|nr:hypothetical protein [Methanothrix sp.]
MANAPTLVMTTPVSAFRVKPNSTVASSGGLLMLISLETMLLAMGLRLFMVASKD